MGKRGRAVGDKKKRAGREREKEGEDKEDRVRQWESVQVAKLPICNKVPPM